MRELIRRRLHGDESGVTLVIVALCLIALFGMIVLVVDVGGLLLNRREMVNASDAAALSAAKSCVLPASKDPRTPEQAADEFAASNTNRAQTAGVNITQISGCDTSVTGYVSVQYAANQHLFFAPVLGVGSDRIVQTAATAVWGPAGAANPLPIVIYLNSFNNCKLAQQIDKTKTCYVWEDNNNVSGSQSSFGLMDLRTDNPSKYGWNSNAGVGCPDPGNGPKDWIENYPDPSVGELPLNYPGPTYVCRVSGNKNVAWASLMDLIDDNDVVDLNDDEDILYFPINRCDNVIPGAPGGQLVSKSTTEAPCGDTPGQYDIIGYAAMKLINVYDPNQVQGSADNCKEPRLMPGVNGGVFDLVTFGTFNLCFTSAPDTISNVTVTKVKGQDPGPQPVLNVDYLVDSSNAANPVVTWIPSGPATDNQNFNVSFDWALGGACGIPPSGNNSGHCLILLPVEVKIGGFNPGGGTADSNVRAYKLCEPAIAGSCSPLTVPIPP